MHGGLSPPCGRRPQRHTAATSARRRHSRRPTSCRNANRLPPVKICAGRLFTLYGRRVFIVGLPRVDLTVSSEIVPLSLVSKPEVDQKKFSISGATVFLFFFLYFKRRPQSSCAAALVVFSYPCVGVAYSATRVCVPCLTLGPSFPHRQVNMSKRQEFVDAASKENAAEFLRFIRLHVSSCLCYQLTGHCQQ